MLRQQNESVAFSGKQMQLQIFMSVEKKQTQKGKPLSLLLYVEQNFKSACMGGCHKTRKGEWQKERKRSLGRPEIEINNR